MRRFTGALALLFASTVHGMDDRSLDRFLQQQSLQRVQDYENDGKIRDADALARSVDRVFTRLLVVALAQDPAAGSLRWEVRLVDDATIGAECYPDGRLLVSRSFAQQHQANDDALAFVLAHEMSHVLLRHAVLYYMAAGTKLSVVGLTPALLMENVDTNGAIRMSLSWFARKQELEADQAAVKLSTAAGYRASGAEDVLTSFITLLGGDSASLSHDRPSVRLQALRERSSD